MYSVVMAIPTANKTEAKRLQYQLTDLAMKADLPLFSIGIDRQEDVEFLPDFTDGT